MEALTGVRGIPLPSWGVSGEVAQLPPQKKILYFPPSKWCMLMHSGLWGTFYTICNCHYDHVIYSKFLKLHMLNSAAKRWTQKFCADFSGSSFSALTLLVGRQEGHPTCKN